MIHLTARRRPGLATTAVALTLAAAVLVACGGSSTPKSSAPGSSVPGSSAPGIPATGSSATGSSSATGATAAGTSTFATLLERTPTPGDDDEASSPVYVGDLAAYAARAGSKVPTSPTEAAAFRAAAFGPQASWAVCPLPNSSICSKPSEDVRAELGFSAEDFSSFAWSGASNSRVLVATGRFDEAALTKAMGASVARFGGKLWAIGTEDQDLTVNTPARPFGQGVRVLLRNGALVVATTEADIEATVAPAPRAGLAQLFGAQLDRERAVSAAIGFGTINVLDRLGPNAAAAQIAAATPPAELPKYLGYAVATLPPAGGERALLLLAFADAASARSAAPVLETIVALGRSVGASTTRSWSASLAGAKVEVAGSFVVLRWQPSAPTQWSEAFRTLDLPILLPPR
jgi:hypothetical protein